MKLSPEFYTEVMRVICGEIIPPTEAIKNAELLDSVEELFAWLLLRKGLKQEDAALKRQIEALACNVITKAETRRQQSGFPIEQKHTLHRLENALHKILAADHAAREIEFQERISTLKQTYQISCVSCAVPDFSGHGFVVKSCQEKGAWNAE